jgi:hypothetical protein
MSAKPKIIAISVAALVAVAGGYYAFSGDAVDSGTQAPVAATPVVADTSMTSRPEVAQAQTGNEAVATTAKSGAEATPEAKAVEGAPKKVTSAQLTPPGPKTEDEKLQKAAEGEYNRF